MSPQEEKKCMASSWSAFRPTTPGLWALKTEGWSQSYWPLRYWYKRLESRSILPATWSFQKLEKLLNKEVIDELEARHQIQFRFSVPNAHFSTGIVERRMRMVHNFLGKMDMQQARMSVTDISLMFNMWHTGSTQCHMESET